MEIKQMEYCFIIDDDTFLGHQVIILFGKGKFLGKLTATNPRYSRRVSYTA